MLFLDKRNLILNVFFILVIPIVASLNFMAGFGKMTPKRIAGKTPEEIVKFRKSQKITGVIMVLLFAFYLFKYIYLNV